VTGRREQARERILLATIRTLARDGYAGTTARAIALTGGFAPGVIYYHFADLDDLFLATMRFTSADRMRRYEHETATVASAAELIDALRRLYAEDTTGGHIAAVQELIAVAPASPNLRRVIAEEVARWQELAEQVVTRLVAGTPLAYVVPVSQVAEAAVALYLGVETLVHLDGDGSRPQSLFDAAEPIAALWDMWRRSS
jgi:AcrR family transcriptional regulator